MRTSTLALTAAGTVASVLAFAAPAAADVTVTPTNLAVTNSSSIPEVTEPVQGQPARLAFTITSTSRTASTTKVQVQLPTDTPIAEVFPLSSPDWAPSLTEKKLDTPIQGGHGGQIDRVVTAITWTAAPGHAVKPGTSSVVEVEAEPMPAADQIVLKLAQTYSDGTVTRSDATVKLNPPTGQAAQGHSGHGGAAAGEPAAAAPANDDPGSGGGTRVALIVSLLVVGLLAGAVVGGVVMPRLRRGAAALTVAREDLDAPAEADEEPARR